MTAKTKTAIAFTVALIVMASLVTLIPTTEAASKVNITFDISGYSTGTASVIFTIDGIIYVDSSLPKTFNWKIGDTHTVKVASSFTGTDLKTYKFLDWTNGNGLTAASETFTVPNSATTVTANFAQSTYTAKFTASGLSNVADYVLIIDGTKYLYSSLSLTSFNWEVGSKHIIEAASKLSSYDLPSKTYAFASWTNGNGLITNSGTFIMPASDVTVTANYGQSTVKVTFETSGLRNLNLDTVLTIDGTKYNCVEVTSINFQWAIGSTHTITAASLLTGWDSKTHYFANWTNGNGLTAASGIFTTPSSNVVVTANYASSQTTTPSSTTLTITCTNSTVDAGNAVTLSGTLSSQGTGIAGKTITLAYYNGTTWCTISTAITSASGVYTYSWVVPASVANGEYPLRATFQGDSSYQACSASTGTNGNGLHLMVLPESWGSIVALAACFVGALVYFKLRSKRAGKAA